MVVYDLVCDKAHRFEGWFGSGDDFEGQRSKRLVECPVCGSLEVDRLPTARIGKGSKVEEPPQGPQSSMEQAVRRIAGALTEAIRRSEDVGRGFSEEARRIHYREAPARSIRGLASSEEVESLREEGIDVMALPDGIAPHPDKLH